MVRIRVRSRVRVRVRVRVRGSRVPGGEARCNSLRSSTAASESRPASISGASGSITTPVTRSTIAITSSNLTAGTRGSCCCGARKSARARAVGKSKTKVEGSRVPAVGLG